MKQWTKHQPRDKHLLDAAGHRRELQAAQSSIASLDRTQIPATGITADMVTAGAIHTVWCKELTTGDRPGEESDHNDADTTALQFQSATYDVYGGGWKTLYEQNLTGFKGGSLFVEWGGSSYVNPSCHQTLNMDYPANPKHLSLRIEVAGSVIVEKMGPEHGCQAFRIFGTAQLPAGDHTVRLQWRGTGPGRDELATDRGGNPVYQYHLWGNKFLAIGRWR